MSIEEFDFDKDLANFTPRQLDALDSLDSGKIKYLLYGGALGGGKSYFLRWWALRRLLELYSEHGITHATGMIACEDYPSLKDRQLQKIGREFPQWIGRMHHDHKEYGRCFILNSDYGNGVICFRNLDDPSKYASSEFAFIGIDELTKNNYDVFTFLRTRLRWPNLNDMETHFVAATNPGSIGHQWVKQLWMDKVFPHEFKSPNDFTTAFDYIPCTADDNPFIDESYWAMLSTLPEQLRKAFRDGDWDIFVGQAFSFSRTRHVIKPIEIPDYAQYYMTYDWGFGAPFSIGWWWVDTDGRIYRFNEWYGWSGQPNSGLRITDKEICREIVRREKEMGIWGRDIVRLAGPDCFQKRPDYRGGGQGPSTSEVFATMDDPIYLTPGDPDRKLKIRMFRERLLVPEAEDEMPMLVVYENCQHFIRTVPNLVVSEINIEDVDTKQEDHVYDEACHICMARPMSLEELPAQTLTEPQRDYHIIRGDIPTLKDGRAVNVDTTES